MVPILLIANALIWYKVYKSYKTDKEEGPYPENPSYDQDLDDLWDGEIIIKFREWQEDKPPAQATIEDYLWEEGIINPDETVWCDGYPLDPTWRTDHIQFDRIRSRAYERGDYNGLPLNEGGQEEMYISWFMMKGCSRYGAEQLLAEGVKPWEVKFNVL